jgi:hypothetical protein
MFRSLTLTACLAITISSFAQKEKADVPAFGKVEKADLEMKECDFDAKAYRVNRKKMLKAPATSPPVTVQEYENFKEFYKQLFAILSEQIAIKKKG